MPRVKKRALGILSQFEQARAEATNARAEVICGQLRIQGAPQEATAKGR
jgi:hypothetical protein